jgi:hypothetical protein
VNSERDDCWDQFHVAEIRKFWRSILGQMQLVWPRNILTSGRGLLCVLHKGLLVLPFAPAEIRWTLEILNSGMGSAGPRGSHIGSWQTCSQSVKRDWHFFFWLERLFSIFLSIEFSDQYVMKKCQRNPVLWVAGSKSQNLRRLHASRGLLAWTPQSRFFSSLPRITEQTTT